MSRAATLALRSTKVQKEIALAKANILMSREVEVKQSSEVFFDMTEDNVEPHEPIMGPFILSL